jgi:hypothetical protein
MNEVCATPLRRWHPQLELADLLNRFEAAAHDCVPAAAQYASNWDPEGMERQYTAEQLALLQADLQRLRPVLEELGINCGERIR